MAATGASHRCCCRRHAGSHKEDVVLRQVMENEDVGVMQVTCIAVCRPQITVAPVSPCGSCHGSDRGKPSVLLSPACRLPQ